MTNDYGVKLDHNGYAPSIFDLGEECFCCGRTLPLQRHEIFHGANRKRSKALGLWITVCYECHYAIHNGQAGLDGILKHRGFEAAKEHYGWTDDEFRYLFGKAYWDEVPQSKGQYKWRNL